MVFFEKAPLAQPKTEAEVNTGAKSGILNKVLKGWSEDVSKVAAAAIENQRAASNLFEEIQKATKGLGLEGNLNQKKQQAYDRLLQEKSEVDIISDLYRKKLDKAVVAYQNAQEDRKEEIEKFIRDLFSEFKAVSQLSLDIIEKAKRLMSDDYTEHD